jgi:thioredoxin reductase (NADPH)
MTELEALEPEGDAWRLTTAEGEVHAQAVILATGARLKTLGVDGEERLQGRGVSHCASCDAPLMRDRVVGVVGGGDSALQEALTLAESVAEVIVLQQGAALTAQATYRDQALEHPKISVRYGTTVDAILGDDTVTGVRITESGQTSELELGGVFVYVGLQPNTELVADLTDRDAEGRIATDATMRTGRPGLLAAGILRRGSLGQAAISAGEGAAAAKAADRYLTDRIWNEQATALATANGGSNG